ncbi:helix-turn-helix transcriptional regulator, partial [Streptomonospora algeriensis]
EIEMIYVISLGGTFDIRALTEICDGGWRTLPGGEGHRIVVWCVVLCHLDRWREAHEILESRREVWSRDVDFVAALGQLISECTAAFLGSTEAFDRAVAAPCDWPLWEKGARHRFERLAQLARTLMLFGERDRAEGMLAAYEPPTGYWPVPDRVVMNSQAGHWAPALDLVRLSLATGLTVGDLPSHTLMWRETSIILGARGQLTRAREAIERAQSAQSLMLHLLAVPEAYLSRVLGAPERVGRIVADALAYAEERGLVVGTDELWLMTALAEAEGGDPVAAQRYVEETKKVAELLGTARAELCHLLATAVVHRDRAAAAEAVRFARRRALPLELADAIGVLVRHGLAEVSLLHEAYAVYGDLGALLRRAKARNLMREHGAAMPRRADVVAENERLLATLVTEGLTNRELAVVLGDSEKSVESRLSRMFKRTGYRSRSELASAMLTGEYL